MSDEVLIGEPGYQWTLNHAMEVSHSMELFRSKSFTVGKGDAPGDLS